MIRGRREERVSNQCFGMGDETKRKKDTYIPLDGACSAGRFVLTKTVSPVNNVGASISLPYSSASAAPLGKDRAAPMTRVAANLPRSF